MKRKNFKFKKIFTPKIKNIKKNVSDALDLPKEIVLNIPLVTILGNEELNIENFKNIIEYSEDKIRLNTNCGIFKIEGENLAFKEISSEKILIIGKLHKLEFLL